MRMYLNMSDWEWWEKYIIKPNSCFHIKKIKTEENCYLENWDSWVELGGLGGRVDINVWMNKTIRGKNEARIEPETYSYT